MSGDDLLARLDRLLAEAKASGDARLLDEIASRAAAAARRRRDTAGEDEVWHGMIGRSAPMLALRERIARFARSAAPVLIAGESGTGKEMVAQALHDESPRASAPFVAENCAAIPATLLESVLFGHRRGSFTGAVADHPGHFVSADGGTLLLDEIGEMPPPMQAKLLRVLQEGEVRPVGGEKTIPVDVRILAATNRDLHELVSEGSFREDLLYRLDVLRLTLPPLRERGDDVLLLAERLLARAAGGRPLWFGDAARDRLRAAAWPGNVRQLQNVVQRVAALADGPEIGAEDLGEELPGADATGGS